MDKKEEDNKRSNVLSSNINGEVYLKVDGQQIDQKEKQDLQYPRQLKFSTLRSKGFYERSSSRGRSRHESNLNLNNSELNESKSRASTERTDRKQSQSPSTNKSGDLDKSIDASNSKRKPSQHKRQEAQKPERNRSKSVRDNNDSEKDEQKQKRKRSISIPSRRKSIKEKKPVVVQQVSSDTDCHLCECCVIDQFDPQRILKNQEGGGFDGDSGDSDSSCDSYCAKVLAEVASKEIFDPSKIQMILQTKQFKEDQYYQQQDLMKQQNEFLRQQQMHEQMQQQQPQKFSRSFSGHSQKSKQSVPLGQQLPLQQQQQQQQLSVYSGGSPRGTARSKQGDHSSIQLQKKSIQDKKQPQNMQNSFSMSQSSGKLKKSRSVHGLEAYPESSDMNLYHLPEILKAKMAPQMEIAPRDRYKIQELIEEMVKQNNKIYKAEKLKAEQDLLEQKEQEKQRKENLKERIKYIQSKHREQFLRKQEEKEMMAMEGIQDKKTHDYQWGLDQRKFNPDLKRDQSVDKVGDNHKKEQNIDEYFKEFIDKVRHKIKKRKQILKKETLKKQMSSKKLFSETDSKQKEKMWNNKLPAESGKKAKKEDEFEVLNQQKKLKEEQKAQEILEERKQKYSSKNKRNLSNEAKDKVSEKRGKRAISQMQKEKKQKKEEKQKLKESLQQLQSKAKAQLEKAKKREFNTLSEMNFDFSSDLQDTPHQSKQDNKKKDTIKRTGSVSNKENSQNNVFKQTPSAGQQAQKQKGQSASSQNIKGSKGGEDQRQSQPPKQGKQAQQPQQQTGQSQKGRVEDNKQPGQDQKQQRQHSADTYGKKQQQQKPHGYNNYDMEEQNYEEDMGDMENIVIDENEYERIQESNKEKEQKVNQLLGSMNLKNVKMKTDYSTPHLKSGQMIDASATGGQINTQELPEDFIEKIFTTAEMHDLPKEYVQAQERKEDKLTGRAFKQFEREIQNELYKRNENPLYTHQKKGGKPTVDHSKLKSEINVKKNNLPKNMQKEKARMNNFENQSKKPTQHLLQGEIVYKESKMEGIREIKHVPPKPRQVSQEEYKRKQQEINKVKIIEPAIPPIEIRRRNEKQKSLKDKYLEEYSKIQDEEKRKEEQILKQQQYILTHDLEDNIFEMANKVAFHQHDQKKSNVKKEAVKTFGFQDDDDSDQDLYADGVEAYNKARQDMIPEVLKNISKTNFANLIVKQKKQQSSINLSENK